MKRLFRSSILLVSLAGPLFAGCLADVTATSEGGSGGAFDVTAGSPGGAGVPGSIGTGGATEVPTGASGGSAGPIVGSGGSVAAPSGTGGAPSGSGGAAAGASRGTGGAGPVVGSGGSTAPASGGATCLTDVIPPLVQNMLNGKCVTCHGATPLPGAVSLVSFANLTAPSRSDPTRTNAALMLVRIQSPTTPMPPVGGTPASAAEVTALRDWVNAGYPKATCPVNTGTGTGTGAGAGAAPGAGPGTGTGGATGVVLPPAPVVPDPFGVGSICTSMSTTSGGASATMNPGQACNNCHRSGGGGGGDDEGGGGGEAPIFAIAGTLYPTGHEPNNCRGVNGTTGARVVITGADGAVFTLTPNASGNFTSQAGIRTPYRAKVTFMGRERLMIATQTNGDCNSCHTQNGANMAPGRIVLP